MLSLEPGGKTVGVVLRLSDEMASDELRLVWIREMPTGAYRPTWADVILDDGRAIKAIAFVANPTHPLYEQDASVSAVAPLIAAASGPLGTNADYVFRLELALSECGTSDEYVIAIATELKRLVSDSATPTDRE
jgi:cation transport protein ChaC